MFSACSLLSEIIIDIIANIYRSIFIYTVFGFLKFLPFLAVSGNFWGFSGLRGFLGVLVSHKITGGIRLVVGRVDNWVWGGFEGVWGCFGGVWGGQRGSA